MEENTESCDLSFQRLRTENRLLRQRIDNLEKVGIFTSSLRYCITELIQLNVYEKFIT